MNKELILRQKFSLPQLLFLYNLIKNKIESVDGVSKSLNYVFIKLYKSYLTTVSMVVNINIKSDMKRKGAR